MIYHFTKRTRDSRRDSPFWIKSGLKNCSIFIEPFDKLGLLALLERCHCGNLEQQIRSDVAEKMHPQDGHAVMMRLPENAVAYPCEG